MVLSESVLIFCTLGLIILNDLILPSVRGCYILNRAMLRPILGKTPYELFKGRTPNISHLRVFGCQCFVLNNGKDNLGKFDPRSDEGIFLGYSHRSSAYKVFNKRTKKVKESVHVEFNEFSLTNTLQDSRKRMG